MDGLADDGCSAHISLRGSMDRGCLFDSIVKDKLQFREKLCVFVFS